MYRKEFDSRNYRNKLNVLRFKDYQIKYLETDLWIGTDPVSFQKEMLELTLEEINNLRQKPDDYIKNEPEFGKCLKPFQPKQNAPDEAIEMALAASQAGIGPMASVAGLFAREAISQNFSVKELVIENGGDIFALLKNELVLSVFAGHKIRQLK